MSIANLTSTNLKSFQNLEVNSIRAEIFTVDDLIADTISTNILIVDTITESAPANGIDFTSNVTMDGDLRVNGVLRTNFIIPAVGSSLIINDTLFESAAMEINDISEKFLNNGVTIENVNINNGVIDNAASINFGQDPLDHYEEANEFVEIDDGYDITQQLTCRLTRIGRVVHCLFQPVQGTVVVGGTAVLFSTVGGISAQFRPSISTFATVTTNQGAAREQGHVNVESDGTIEIYSDGNETIWAGGVVCGIAEQCMVSWEI